MKYKLNENNNQWQTSTIIFLMFVILALAISLFLSMGKRHLLSCRDYQYDVNGKKICLISEEDLIR